MQQDIEMANFNPNSEDSLSKVEISIDFETPYGKYSRYCKIKNKYLINLGPQFIVQLIIMIFSIPLGTLVVYSTYGQIPNWIWKFYTFIFLLMIYVHIHMLFSDPGIVSKKHHLKAQDIQNDENFVKCSQCGFVDSTAIHCDDCDVCIEGYDHHCDVIGKCIGKGNLILFYLFVSVIPVFLWATIFVGIMFLNSDI